MSNFQINNIFSEQKEKINAGQSFQDETEGVPLIKFEFHEGKYAVHISHVVEIVEPLPIAPYPEKQKNHIGIVNIRGQIIPVVDLSLENKPKSVSPSLRLLMLEFQSHHPFVIFAEKIQKFVYNDKNIAPGQIINLNNVPVCYVNETMFMDSLEGYHS